MKTEKVLATMIKQGYIEKVRDANEGDPRSDYYLGPRGKIEVGKRGTMDIVKKVTPEGGVY
jgi:melanoma-associated antigen